jgi:DNA-binding FadR family transcriptional regulator
MFWFLSGSFECGRPAQVRLHVGEPVRLGPAVAAKKKEPECWHAGNTTTSQTSRQVSGCENDRMTTVHRESLAEQAAGLLLARIRAGEWEIGGRLPGETTLASQLGVGRSTMREAIRLLAGRDVLSTRQGAGVFVTATDVPEAWGSVLRRADIAAVIEARTAIEVEAAALAADRRTSAELSRMRDALAERGRHRADLDEHVATDAAFHRSVVVAAHSPILLELFDGFEPRSRQAMTEMLRGRGRHGDDADQAVHERIYDAIASRDSQAAVTLARAHLTALRSMLG